MKLIKRIQNKYQIYKDREFKTWVAKGIQMLVCNNLLKLMIAIVSLIVSGIFVGTIETDWSIAWMWVSAFTILGMAAIGGIIAWVNSIRDSKN